MAKKVKITKDGQTVYPATVMDAVVHKDLRVDSSKLIEEVNVSKIFPTGGIDGTNKYTLETAIAKIPASLRSVGIKCSFLDDATGMYRTVAYIGKPDSSYDQIRNWGDITPINRLFIYSTALPESARYIHDIQLSKPLKKGTSIKLNVFGKSNSGYRNCLQIIGVDPVGTEQLINIVIDSIESEPLNGIQKHSLILKESDVFEDGTEISFEVDWDGVPVQERLFETPVLIDDKYVYHYSSLKKAIQKAPEEIQSMEKGVNLISSELQDFRKELKCSDALAGVYFSLNGKARDIILSAYILNPNNKELPGKCWYVMAKNLNRNIGDLQRFSLIDGSADDADYFLQYYNDGPTEHSGIEWIKLTSYKSEYSGVGLMLKVNWDAMPAGSDFDQDDLGCHIVLSELNVSETATRTLKEELSTSKNEIKTIQEELNAFKREKPLSGHGIIVFGDSITELKDSNDKHWTDYLAEITGANVHNAGIGGSQLNMRYHFVKLKITGQATRDGTVTVNAGRTISADILATDTVEDIAEKLALSKSGNAFVKAIGNTLYSGVWDSPSQWRDTSKCSVVTETGITYEWEQNYWVGLPDNINSFEDDSVAYAALDIPAMICGFVNDDWMSQKEAAEYLKNNASDDNTGILDKISQVKMEDVDSVIIFGGTNNYNSEGFGTPGGEPANSVSWHLGKCIEELLKKKPSLHIYVLTPICRYFGNDISNWDDSKWGDNFKYGEYDFIAMPTLVEAEKAVARFWHIPVFDMYWNLGWNKWNYSRYFNNTDGTHPKKGLKYLGGKIASFLLSAWSEE